VEEGQGEGKGIAHLPSAFGRTTCNLAEKMALGSCNVCAPQLKRWEDMKNTLIVVTDLGAFKAYRLEKTHPQGTPRLEPLEEFFNQEAHSKLTEKLTDSAGRNRSPASRMATTMGEQHNLKLELRKRLVKQLAGKLNALLRPDDFDHCFFAASKEINHQILAELPDRVRAKIVKNIQADLTKAGRSDLLKHF
jgi:hypothetical protein